jgi:DNA mismatch repair protein MutS2
MTYVRLPLLIQYQDFLSDVDVIAAKAICQPINGIMPLTDNADFILEMPTTHFVFNNRKRNYASAKPLNSKENYCTFNRMPW